MIESNVAAGQRVRDATAERPLPAVGRSVRNPALEIFLWTRTAIWLAAVFALLAFEPNRHPQAARWDTPQLHELGYGIAVWARWDSAFFVRIAGDGYDSSSAAFFPLYPALVAALGRLLAGHYVLAGVLISLAASAAAFWLLYRLAEPRLGVEGARRTVLYLALFPMTLFLLAVYSESLFLLLALGAFVLAERGRFLGAALATGLALLTRPFGLALLPAIVLLAWRSGERRRALSSLALAPLVAAVYPLFLWRELGDPWAFARAQDVWHRELSPAGPLGGIWNGIRVVVTGDTPAGAAPLHATAVNLEGLAALVLFAALAFVAWRRFGAPYGLFAALSLALPLSVPSERWPLLSLPRFGVVVFPFFLALAWLGRNARANAVILGTSAVFLGIAVTQWALWQWVS
jgi:hypothetical protein